MVTGLFREKSPQRTDRRDRRDGERALIAVACLASAITFAAFVDTGERTKPESKIDRGAVAATTNTSDDDIYTGSILFMPMEGNACRQHLLDNVTGRIWDNGVVACDSALAKGSAGKNYGWSAARIDAVRDGFRR
jgi:hypothetical protein